MAKALLPKSDFSEAFRLQMWAASNRLVWGSLFFLIFICILDFILLPSSAIELIILNLITIILIVAIQITLTKIQQKPTRLLHLVLFTLNFLSLYSIGIANFPATYIYLSFIAILFVCFNSMAIWTSTDAIFQFIMLCLLFVGMSSLEIIDFDKLLSHGAYTTLSIVAISSVFPAIRLLHLSDEIKENYIKEQQIKDTKNHVTTLEKENDNCKKKLKSIEKKSKIFRHDLKNKLASVETLIELTELDGRFIQKEGQHNYLEMIKNSLKDSRNEVQNFLSDIDGDEKQNSVSLDLTEINIHTLLQTNLYKFSGKISSRNIQIASLLKANKYHVMLEKNYADIAIFNLLKYAMDFSKNNDHLSLITKNQDNYFILEIVNRDTGMSMRELESYFKNIDDYKYKEIHLTKGLGLSIAKNHMELMGGQLRFSASDSLGFEFIVEFPIKTIN